MSIAPLRVIVLIGNEQAALELGRLIKQGRDREDDALYVSANLYPAQFDLECKRGKAVVARVRTANNRKFVSSLPAKYNVSAWLVRLRVQNNVEEEEADDFSAEEMASFSKIIVVHNIAEQLESVAKEIQLALFAVPFTLLPPPPMYVSTVSMGVQKSQVRRALQSKFGVLHSFSLQRGVLKVAFDHDEESVDVAVGKEEVLHMVRYSKERRVVHSAVIRGLAAEVSANDLEPLFVKFDDKVKVTINRCVAMVSFSTKEALDQCLLLQSTITLNGITMQVKSTRRKTHPLPTKTEKKEPVKPTVVPTKEEKKEPVKPTVKEKSKSKPTLAVPSPPPNRAGVVIRGVTESDQQDLFACIQAFGQVEHFTFTYRSCKLAFANPQQAKALLSNPPVFRDGEKLNVKTWTK